MAPQQLERSPCELCHAARTPRRARAQQLPGVQFEAVGGQQRARGAGRGRVVAAQQRGAQQRGDVVAVARAQLGTEAGERAVLTVFRALRAVRCSSGVERCAAAQRLL